jgi:hypothetical protein
LSRDKSSSKNPGTNSSVPGQSHCLIVKKEKNAKNAKIVQKKKKKYSFFPSVPWLSWDIPRPDGTDYQNPLTASPVAKCQITVLGPWPVLWQDFELVLLSLCPGTMKGLLSYGHFFQGQ